MARASYGFSHLHKSKCKLLLALAIDAGGGGKRSALHTLFRLTTQLCTLIKQLYAALKKYNFTILLGR
jgi:hypothetical protein